MEPINLFDALVTYNQKLPHQSEAIKYLIANTVFDPVVVEKFAQKYRQPPAPKEPKPTTKSLVTSVPFFPQTDNYRDPDRTCFSSTCAMLLAYMKPGVIASDDVYVERVFSIGDTTNPQVQIQALSSFGLKASFETNLGEESIEESLESGVPVPVGFLHRGTAPNFGGGHWAIVLKLTKNSYILHDPYGSLLDGYTGSVYNGKAVEYPKSVFNPRWQVEGKNTGWGILAKA